LRRKRLTLIKEPASNWLFFIFRYSYTDNLLVWMLVVTHTTKRKPPQFQLENAHGASVLEQQLFLNLQFAGHQFSRLTIVIMSG